MKHILIGGAWPYANGSLHIGHIAALLPGDALARYYRAKGDNVIYVSGSDCYGTPITVRAAREQKSPAEIAAHYHREFCEVFQKLGFSYDCYTCTTDPHHTSFVQDFHRNLYESAYVAPKTVKTAYCPRCQKLLTDRLVTGLCPVCQAPTRGDQCDACGEILEPNALLSPHCANCNTPLEFRETNELYLLVTKLEPQLRAFWAARPHWRKNAAAFTKRYLDEGLRDRAITRDLDWGIPVPKEGFDDKKIYIWAENVLGYLSAAARVCAERRIDLAEVFGDNARHYYVHGKDNIPFHTIILPALLLAEGHPWRLPDDIVSSEHLTLEGKKISTSGNWAIWAHELVERFHPDAIRYFFFANGPEKRDGDFSWREFQERNNGELVGAWGNLVNRTLAFITKYLGRTIPSGKLDPALRQTVETAFDEISALIERASLRDALAEAFELVRAGNKFYDAHEPWKTRTTDPQACDDAIFSCTWLIANLATLLHPFLPTSSQEILDRLNLRPQWTPQTIAQGAPLPDCPILFSRIDLPENRK